MDTKNAKKTSNKSTENETVKLTSHAVERVRVIEGKNGKNDLIFFTAIINGVSINNCRVMSGKKGDFIAFPEEKGKNGEYYKIVYIPLSDDDQKTILKDVQDAINNM